MRLYLAGKIGKGDWRHGIVRGLRGAFCDGDEVPKGILKNAIFGEHDYCGPFFVSCDHGCGHGSNSHGVGLNGAPCIGPSYSRLEISDACMYGVQHSEAVFAWIESTDCHGTLFELGVAHGIGLPIGIGFSPEVKRTRDLWLMSEQADFVATPNIRTAEECLRTYINTLNYVT